MSMDKIRMLDSRWSIPVGDNHSRLIAGPKGLRVVSDRGQMVLVDEDEFTAAKSSGWHVINSDPWAAAMDHRVTGTHELVTPDEIRSRDSTLAIRYGDAWFSQHYIDIALRLGGETIVTTGPLSPARVSGLCVIMPMKLDDASG